MNEHQLIDKIVNLACKISQKNRILREAELVAKEKDELETELKQLMWQYLQQEGQPKKVFVFKGKTKDLLADLQSEIQKAQS